MNKLNFIHVFLVILISACGQGDSTDLSIRKPKKTQIKKALKAFHCDYDSMIVQEYKITKSYNGYKTENVYVLSSKSIQIVKPYLIDSIIHDYSCCPELVTGELIVYSGGQVCEQYFVDSVGAFGNGKQHPAKRMLVARGYQTRINIPIDTWNQIMRGTKQIKIGTKSN